MKVQLIRNVKLPQRGTDKSAGIDFFVPEDFPTTTLKTNESALIPSGVKVHVPSGYALIAFNKSGVATKIGLIKGAEVVDEDYEGEIHIHVINTSDKDAEIKPGMKLIQFILVPVNYDNVEQVEFLEKRNTQRGEGGFGSTGV
jgi:dUTP pyrophosphatase